MVGDLNNQAFSVRTGLPRKAVHMTHHVHFVGDEGLVSKAFKEGEWLEYGVGDLQLLMYEVLTKSIF